MSRRPVFERPHCSVCGAPLHRTGTDAEGNREYDECGVCARVWGEHPPESTNTRPRVIRRAEGLCD